MIIYIFHIMLLNHIVTVGFYGHWGFGRLLTFLWSFAILSSVIVLRKLAKPVTGGELSSLSPFLLRRKQYGTAKDIFNLFRAG